MLILGGSSEATALALALRNRADIAPLLSLAGRTADPPPLPVPARIGGFGGVEGLARYLVENAVDMLVDATHPFAVRISRHAREAAAEAGVPLLRVSREGWAREPGDRWRYVDDFAQAAEALGTEPRSVFLTIGSLNLSAFVAAPHHRYLVRTIDPVPQPFVLPSAEYITARGPFATGAEADLMRRHGIEILVTKDSGGAAAVAKLAAARELGVEVILIRRPGPEASLSVAEALARIDAYISSARRGV